MDQGRQSHRSVQARLANGTASQKHAVGTDMSKVVQGLQGRNFARDDMANSPWSQSGKEIVKVYNFRPERGNLVRKLLDDLAIIEDVQSRFQFRAHTFNLIVRYQERTDFMTRSGEQACFLFKYKILAAALLVPVVSQQNTHRY